MREHINPSSEAFEPLTNSLSRNRIVNLAELIIRDVDSQKINRQIRKQRTIGLVGNTLFKGLMYMGFAFFSYGDTRAYRAFKERNNLDNDY